MAKKRANLNLDKKENLKTLILFEDFISIEGQDSR